MSNVDVVAVELRVLVDVDVNCSESVSSSVASVVNVALLRRRCLGIESGGMSAVDVVSFD